MARKFVIGHQEKDGHVHYYTEGDRATTSTLGHAHQVSWQDDAAMSVQGSMWEGKYHIHTDTQGIQTEAISED